MFTNNRKSISNNYMIYLFSNIYFAFNNIIKKMYRYDNIHKLFVSITFFQNDYDYYNHTLTYGLPEVHDMLSRWTSLLVDFGKQNKTEK